MMKKAVKLFIVLSAIVGTATTVRAEGDKGLIGITTSMYTNEGLTILCDTLKDAVEEQGYTGIIKDANLDQVQQTKDVEDFINQGAKLIIVEACDSVGVKSAFELCEKAGVPVLSVNQILDDDLIEMIAGTVTADNYQAGYEVGEALAEEMNHEGGGSFDITLWGILWTCEWIDCGIYDHSGIYYYSCDATGISRCSISDDKRKIYHVL